MANSSSPTPFVKPPPGIQSNFQNPKSLAFSGHIVFGICISVATLFFLTRSYVRVWIKRTWIFEDYLAFAGWSGTVAYCGITISILAHNGGKHVWDITFPQAEQARYWLNVGTIEYGVAICATKLAVLWLYRRIFSPRRWSPLDISIVSLIVIVVTFYVATTFIKIFQCNPRAKIIDDNIPGTCIDISKTLDSTGVFNIVTDFIILLLPIKAVWNLRVKKQKKLIIVLAFTFGLCAPVFSLVGLVVRFRVSGSRDTTWGQAKVLPWAAAELTAGNLCVCFPEMNLLFRRATRRRSSTNVLEDEIKMTNARASPNHGIGSSFARSNKRSTDKESYLELSGNDRYGVYISQTSNGGLVLEPDRVHVLNEVTVESHGA